MPEIESSQGTLRYRDEGSGPFVVLIHGALVNATVWDRLLPPLAAGTRVIAPDLPLGSHRTPMNPDADLSPPGLGALIAELLERLELDQVTLVGNDTGGALCQLVCAHHPERISRLVLTNMGLTTEPLPDELVEGWVAPLRDRRIRRDFVRVIRGISNEHTIEAARRLGRVERPALIAWGMRDKLFPFADAERLAAALPNARIEKLENARTFVQLDAPAQLAELIAEFASAPAPARP